MTKQQLQEAIEQRESEVSGYQVNIDNYTRMIADLPCEWPDDLIGFKGKEISFITLRTERLEQRKSLLVLKIHKDQLEEHENVLPE